MNKYTEKQNRLKKKATIILKDLKIIELLSKFGEVYIVGSYAYDLMTWEDIDIHVAVKEIKNKYAYELVDYLFEKKNIYKLALQDFRKSIYSGRPQGLYCKVTYLEKPDIFWKIDVWFFVEGNDDGIKFVDWVKSNMTEEKRITILKIKSELGERLSISTGISGSQVVRAVLENNVRNIEECENYLKKPSMSKTKG